MKRTLVVVIAFLSLAVSAALAAPPADKGKPENPGHSSTAPGQSAEKNAAKACKAERALGAQAFKDKYGTNASKANAFGKCVSGTAKKADDDEAREEHAEKNAAKACKAERALGAQAFTDKYGTNVNKANAFGKCVSKLAKEHGSTS